MTEPYNVLDGELEADPEPPGFCQRFKRFGPSLGAELLGMSVYELGPGESVCPYHYEYDEEWLFVLSGRPVLRDPEGEHELEPWDVVCFPVGPAGAHQVFNRGTSRCASRCSRRSRSRRSRCIRTATRSVPGRGTTPTT